MTLNRVNTEKITNVFKSIFNLLLSENLSISLTFTSFLTLQAKIWLHDIEIDVNIMNSEGFLNINEIAKFLKTSIFQSVLEKFT